MDIQIIQRSVRTGASIAVILKNGDRVRGIVAAFDSDLLVLTTPAGGTAVLTGEAISGFEAESSYPPVPVLETPVLPTSPALATTIASVSIETRNGHQVYAADLEIPPEPVAARPAEAAIDQPGETASDLSPKLAGVVPNTSEIPRQIQAVNERFQLARQEYRLEPLPIDFPRLEGHLDGSLRGTGNRSRQIGR